MKAHFLEYLAEIGATHLHAGGRASTEKLIAALDLQPGERILEIGCGAGATMRRLCREDCLTIIGIDTLPAMLRVARITLGATALLVRADATSGLPFSSESCDAVFAESVMGIQSAAGIGQMLGEIHRVLRPGGRFAVNEGFVKSGISSDYARGLANSQHDAFGFSSIGTHGWCHQDFLEAIRAAGMNPIRVEMLPKPNHGRTFTNWRLFWFRLKAKLRPSIALRGFRYRRAMRGFRESDPAVEARLFVAIKPFRSSGRSRPPA